MCTEDRWAGRLSAADFPDAVEVLGRIKLPKRVEHRSPQVRRDLAPRCAPPGWGGSRRRASSPARGAGRPGAVDAAPGPAGAPLPRLRRPGGARPLGRAARPPGAGDRVAAAEGAGHDALAGPAFDRIRALLAERGYLVPAGETEPGEEEITPHGRILARLWGESDLLAAECLRHGAWDGLEPEELAAVVSALVYESRRDDAPMPRLPPGPVSEALERTVRLWEELDADQRRHKAERTRAPDLAFAWPMHRWARGESLAQVLEAAERNGHELSAGDFVRWTRQVLDLLDQIAGAPGGRARSGRRPTGPPVPSGVVWSRPVCSSGHRHTAPAYGTNGRPRTAATSTATGSRNDERDGRTSRR